MTRPTQEQMKALFGKPGAFDVFFIAKPRSMAQVIDAFLDEPGVVAQPSACSATAIFLPARPP